MCRVIPIFQNTRNSPPNKIVRLSRRYDLRISRTKLTEGKPFDFFSSQNFRFASLCHQFDSAARNTFFKVRLG